MIAKLPSLRNFGRRAVCLVALTVPAFYAVAQQENAPAAPTPPTPSKADEPPAIMSFLLLAVLVGAIVGANLIATKRSHQD